MTVSGGTETPVAWKFCRTIRGTGWALSPIAHCHTSMADVDHRGYPQLFACLLDDTASPSDGRQVRTAGSAVTPLQVIGESGSRA